MSTKAGAPTSTRDIVVEAGRPSIAYWRDVWEFRALFLALTWRDFSVRYKQAVLGVAWAVIQPLSAMIVFTVVFGRIANLPDGGVPYPIMVLAGLLPWQLFSTCVSNGSQSIVSNAPLVTKVYFPRIYLPASAGGTALADAGISFALLLGMMAWYQFLPPMTILVAPLLLVGTLFTAIGLSLWLGALNARYRDVRYVVPFLLQFGLYLTPVGFSSEAIPEQWRLLLALNPMAGIVDGFRWALLGQESALGWAGTAVSVVVTIGLMAIGLWQFRRLEREMADVV